MQDPRKTQSVATDQYNLLINLPFEEGGRINKVEWNLRGLKKKDPGNLPTAVAYLQAVIMTGNAECAHEVAESIWPRRLAAEDQVAWAYVTQLVDLGQFARARELLYSLRQANRLDGAPDVIGTAIHIAVGEGDLQHLQAAAKACEGTATSQNIILFIERLRNSGIEALFQGHQEIVRSVISKVQCTYEVTFMNDEDGPELSVFVYVNASRTDRRVLEAALDAKLTTYYTEKDVDPVCYVPWFTTSVLSLTACPAPARTRH